METADRSNADGEHISRLSTAWTCLFEAHGDDAEARLRAREQLVRRYGGPIRRYLMAIVRQPDAVDELFQEFSLRLVRGDFHRVHPDRGRFRDFLKSVLYHLVVDFHRNRKQEHVAIADGDAPADPKPNIVAASEAEFLDAWRKELLVRVWRALETFEARTGQITYTALRMRADHPEISSAELAGHLSSHLGRNVSVGWVRKRLFLARRKLTQFLREEIEGTLEKPTPEGVREELESLDLARYVKFEGDRR